MTQTSTTRRVATVSGGALLLCLSFGGTALAGTPPTSSTDLGPVSGITDPLPLPSPTATPDPVQVVTQTVQKVAQTAGVPLPSATPTTAPAPAPGGKTSGSTQKVPTTTVKVPSSTRQGRVLGTEHSRPAVAPASIGNLQLGGLRGTSPVPAVVNPVIAPQQTAVLAAGQTPVLAPKAGNLIGGDSNSGNAPRGLFIALATMVIGGLAAGHVKVIQDRLKGITTTA